MDFHGMLSSEASLLHRLLEALSKESSINEVLQAGDTIRRLQARPSACVQGSPPVDSRVDLGPNVLVEVMTV